MQCQNMFSVRQAIYQTFMIPALPRALTNLPCVYSTQHTSHLSTQSSRRTALPLTHYIQQPQPNRGFTTTTRSLAKTRPPEANKGVQKWDEEITARMIMLVDPRTNRVADPETGQLPEQRTRYDVLNSLDRRTHRLLQVSPDGEVPVICKIINKKEYFDAEKKRKLERKETRKEKKVVQSVKTLELNWAIDGNDLGHRLERMGEFLAEGRKVEVVLAVKKQGRKADRRECENVMGRIREAVQAVPGAKEVSVEGKLGGFVTMLFQGKPVAEREKEKVEVGKAAEMKAG